MVAETWSQEISYCEASESMAMPTGTVRDVARAMEQPRERGRGREERGGSLSLPGDGVVKGRTMLRMTQ